MVSQWTAERWHCEIICYPLCEPPGSFAFVCHVVTDSAYLNLETVMSADSE
jgi:hypothetical protein